MLTRLASSVAARPQRLLQVASQAAPPASGRRRWKSGYSGFKLVATDLDGTFMEDTPSPPWVQVPSARNIAAVQRLLEMGVYVVPFSGRMIPCMAPLLNPIGPNADMHPLTYIGGYNGGVVVGPSPAVGEPRPVLRRTTLCADAIRSAIDYCEANSLLVKIFHTKGDGTFGVSSCGDYDYPAHDGAFFAACGEFPYPPDHPVAVKCLEDHTRELYRDIPYFIERVPYDAELIASFNPYKLVVMTRDQDHHIAQIAATSPGAGELFDNVRGNFWFEYMPKGVNKSSGLAWLAEHLGFTLDECVAFGDSSNDLEMLRDAGLGIAMKNGRDDVKAVAAETSEYTNDEHAVGREIERLIDAGAFE